MRIEVNSRVHTIVALNAFILVSRETGSAVPSRASLLISIVGLNLVLTWGIPSEFRRGVHLVILNRHHRPSGQSRVSRVTQLRTDGVHCRESNGTGASKPQGSSKRVLPWQVTMDQLICASLCHISYFVRFLLLRTLVVERRRQSESIEPTLDME